MANIDAVEDELERLSMVISAAENWAGAYSQHPESHAKVIRIEAKLARVMRKHFKTLANDGLWRYINWTHYHSIMISAHDKATGAIKADAPKKPTQAQVAVIFDDSSFTDDEGDSLLQVLHDPLLDGMGAGISAGQAIYNRDIGMSTNQSSVLDAARKYSAGLVKDVTSTTRDRIQQSITTSISLGEDQSAAADRLSGIVNDPKRAEVIARTEAVNSYNKGLMSFAGESGAVGKVWQDNGAEDVCAENSDAGEIAIDDTFPSGDDAPAAHPNCRCGMQLIYSNGDTEEDDS